MSTAEWDSTTAWRTLLGALGSLDETFLDGPKAVADEQGVVEGYRFLATALGVALDTYVFSDPQRPVFLDVNTPFRPDRRWGGDNTDCWYTLATLDPTRTYEVTGQRGDSTYFSLTVYNEPAPGSWSDRVVGIVNDTDLTLTEDGRFSLLLGPSKPEGYDGCFITLTDDAAVAFTRDYQVDPATGQRVTWQIRCLDDPDPLRRTDAQLARGLEAAVAWLKTMFAIVPMTLAQKATLGHESPVVANVFAPAYQVRDANFGWSARDAVYAFMSFDLADDDALVITHRPPTCRFWNVIVWDQFMAGHNAGDAKISLNLGTAVPNPDGTVTVVVTRDQLDHPNAITTVDHQRGMVAFRWFLVDAVPDTPTCDVVPRAAALALLP